MEQIPLSHKVTLSDREKLTVTGVSEVVSFDENMVHMETAQGSLLVHGRELRLKNLSPDHGQLELSGQVEALIYEEPKRKGGIFGRILG